MVEAVRYPTLQPLADLEQQGRPARKSLSYAFLTTCAKCVSLALLYYVLVAVSMKLRFSASGLSLVWPSNAVLVAVLTLSPKRRWWMYLISAEAWRSFSYAECAAAVAPAAAVRTM